MIKTYSKELDYNNLMRILYSLRLFPKQEVVVSSEMISISNQIRANRDVLSTTYHIKRIGIFGSVVRDEQTKDSDIDTLIELSEPISLFQYFALQDFLESILKSKVDLVTIESLKPHIGMNILKEVVFI